jgi:hypothetical protein
MQRVFIAIARILRCTLASDGESPKWILIVENMAETRRKLLQLLEGKHL